MGRVKRGVTQRARHKKVSERAKGYYGRRKNVFRTAIQAVEKAAQYAYRDRRTRKRDFRALWIQRINAGVRQHGTAYSQFMNGLKRAVSRLTARCLSDLAIHDPTPSKPWSTRLKPRWPPPTMGRRRSRIAATRTDVTRGRLSTAPFL